MGPTNRAGRNHTQSPAKVYFLTKSTHRGCNLLLYFFQLFTSLLIFYLFVTIYINITFPLFFYLPLFLAFLIFFLLLWIYNSLSHFIHNFPTHKWLFLSFSHSKFCFSIFGGFFKTFSCISTLGWWIFVLFRTLLWVDVINLCF